MKAIVQSRYGPPEEVLELQEVEKPVVGDHEVLVKVHASSVNIADWIFLTGRPYPVRLMSGLLRPKCRIPGLDVAGRVEAVGKSVTRFKPGDEVYGESKGGAYAEYVSVSEELLVPKPANLTFDQAAAVPLAGGTAVRGLRDCGRIKPGHQVLVNGASGAVGTFAVQVAKAFGAEVTGVCSPGSAEMVRSIGANRVSDYTREDFTQTGERYDLILDFVGSRPLKACRRILTPDGVYVSSAGRLTWVLKAFLVSLVRKRQVVMLPPNQKREDLLTLTEFIEAGEVTPVIDRVYKLSEVPLALKHQGDGHARGKKVITV
jgi:NADPH:quinone reductase-like Zn-dependent oxidoreductase